MRSFAGVLRKLLAEKKVDYRNNTTKRVWFDREIRVGGMAQATTNQGVGGGISMADSGATNTLPFL